MLENLSFDIGVPGPPSFLTDEGKKEYKRVAKLVEAAAKGHLQQVDWAVLTKYAQAWDDVMAYSLKLQEKGEEHVIEGEKGGKYMNPYYNLRQNAWKRLDEACAKLGFSPLDRSKLKTNQEEDSDGLDDLR